MGAALDLLGTVLAISQIPYGRPTDLSPAGVIASWRGTCSTKHMLLAALMREAWPQVPFSLWHRVYRVEPAWAAERWGREVADSVPQEGLIDVHTFARADLGVRQLLVDVTFPVAAWDGQHDMPLACGPGEDHPAGADPLASKAALVAAHCNHRAREAFIAAISRAVS
jgi:hypothetical protein